MWKRSGGKEISKKLFARCALMICYCGSVLFLWLETWNNFWIQLKLLWYFYIFFQHSFSLEIVVNSHILINFVVVGKKLIHLLPPIFNYKLVELYYRSSIFKFWSPTFEKEWKWIDIENENERISYDCDLASFLAFQSPVVLAPVCIPLLKQQN